jgi:hypothetical protein
VKPAKDIALIALWIVTLPLTWLGFKIKHYVDKRRSS